MTREIHSAVNNDAITRACQRRMSDGHLDRGTSPVSAFGMGWRDALDAIVQHKLSLSKEANSENPNREVTEAPSDDFTIRVLNSVLSSIAETEKESVTFAGSSSQIGAIQAWLDGGEYRMGIGTQDINDKALLTIDKRSGRPRIITVHRGDTITKDYHGVITVTLAQRKERRES